MREMVHDIVVMREMRLKTSRLLQRRRFSSWMRRRGNSLGTNWILLKLPRSLMWIYLKLVIDLRSGSQINEKNEEGYTYGSYITC